MTRVFIVRHGESEGNAIRAFHGQYMSDLTERGHKQAECTARLLEKIHIDAIYASDIPRAYNTALHTAEKKGMEVIKCKGFREIKAGEWENKLFEDLGKQYPKEFDLWYNNISECVLPGGESVAELAERVKKAFIDVCKENDGKTIMIATHATPIRSLYCLFYGKDLSEMKNVKWVPNASVSVIDCDNKGSYKVHEYGYNEHLEKSGLLTVLPKNI